VKPHPPTSRVPTPVPDESGRPPEAPAPPGHEDTLAPTPEVLRQHSLPGDLGHQDTVAAHPASPVAADHWENGPPPASNEGKAPSAPAPAAAPPPANGAQPASGFVSAEEERARGARFAPTESDPRSAS